MRQWMVAPKIMRLKHLLGEHVEHHMFLGTIIKKKSVSGYIKNNLLEPKSLKYRHDQIAQEMVNRKINHKTPFNTLPDLSYLKDEEQNYIINNELSLQDLLSRCSNCYKNFIEKNK